MASPAPAPASAQPANSSKLLRHWQQMAALRALRSHGAQRRTLLCAPPAAAPTSTLFMTSYSITRRVMQDLTMLTRRSLRRSGFSAVRPRSGSWLASLRNSLKQCRPALPPIRRILLLLRRVGVDCLLVAGPWRVQASYPPNSTSRSFCAQREPNYS